MTSSNSGCCPRRATAGSSSELARHLVLLEVVGEHPTTTTSPVGSITTKSWSVLRQGVIEQRVHQGHAPEDVVAHGGERAPRIVGHARRAPQAFLPETTRCCRSTPRRRRREACSRRAVRAATVDVGTPSSRWKAEHQIAIRWMLVGAEDGHGIRGVRRPGGGSAARRPRPPIPGLPGPLLGRNRRDERIGEDARRPPGHAEMLDEALGPNCTRTYIEKTPS